VISKKGFFPFEKKAASSYMAVDGQAHRVFEQSTENLEDEIEDRYAQNKEEGKKKPSNHWVSKAKELDKDQMPKDA